ncbi:MAG: type IX secretion system sortase PorU [Bacteroidales bacterium]|nr:type IX secretion system sortase PorU [Bacteroidales bacterium]
MRKSRYILTILMLVAMAATAYGQYAPHSVLANGDWWKIGIKTSGVYTINADNISALSGCSVNDIALYGHRGGQLNSRNGDPRPDDLAEIPIKVYDNNSNGTFDGGDYILFYAEGANRWDFDSTVMRVTHTTHHYSTANYLYLTIAGGTHSRIEETPYQTPSWDAITTTRSVALHENELTNTHKSGQIWVGERFYSSNKQQTFTLTLPAPPTGNLSVRYALASVSTASSEFRVTVNGSTRTHPFTSNVRYRTYNEEFASNGSATINVTVEYRYNESLASGYLDYIEIYAETPTTYSGGQTTFYADHLNNIVRQYQVSGTGSETQVWDVTDYNGVRSMPVERNGSTLTFTNIPDRWRTYIAFNANTYLTPASITKIGNQDLHGMAVPELVIVCHPALQEQAYRLANLHSINDDIDVLVVPQEVVFNEFSSGKQDPIAIREMLRMFRSRAQASGDSTSPRHLLLFGKGTYDNRDIMGNELPTVVTYQTSTSFDDDGASVCTDDIMTYLDDGENLSNVATMDVSVGRLPAKNGAEAKHLVDKIEHYMMRSDLMQDGIRGDWRNSVALLADDADPSCGGDTVFTNSSEITAKQITARYPQFNIDKIYADAYVQQSGADGSYYPDVNNALKKRLNYGCLLLNYIGHGSSQYIGTERFMMKSDISGYANFRQLPFFITSTCTFGRYDVPNETCGAEEFLLADGAGIACAAASRPIAHIQTVNTEMVMQALDPANTIGDAIRIAKNKRSATQSLALIGDPALRLSHPQYKVVVTAINGREVDSLHADTALVLSTVTVEGEIRDRDGLLVDDFDGTIYPEVYDRAVSTHTLANDNDGYEVAFTLQNNMLYKGHATVSGGRFSYHFTVPRDVAYKFDRAKLSHYAKSSTDDATGAYLNLYLGGFDESVDLSESRPEINLYMNDTNFRSGGITDASPTLLAVLYDSVGINAVGSGLGHDITATLDGNPNNIIILNDFYETDINDEHRGTIRYNISGLTSGRHTIRVKAWNIFNYSNSADIVFYVHSGDTSTTSFAASPNPASEQVSLSMEHNCKGSIAGAQLEIFDMQGRRVKTFTPAIAADSYVVGPVLWNLCGDNGMRVPPGVYIARFTVTTDDGERLFEKGKVIVK